MVRFPLPFCLLLTLKCVHHDSPILGAQDPGQENNSHSKSEPISISKTSSEVLSDIDTFIGQEAEKLAVPAIAVGIIQDGKLSSAKGYGTLPQAASISAKTVFRLGSITKVITSAAILHLRDDDKLSLEDPVAKFVPELKNVLAPKESEPIRLKHLLQHRSGIPTLGDGTLDWTDQSPVTDTQLLESIRNSELHFVPGEQFEYSNVAMALAGVVVARASGTSYREYVDNNLLIPLGMSSTRWEQGAYPKDTVFPGYFRKTGGFEPAENHWVLGTIESAGGLYSTINDMAAFLSFQIDPKAANQVLSAPTVHESQTRSTTQDERPVGLGWFIYEESELGKVIWHNGATGAYGAWIGLDPKKKNAVILFVNAGDMRVVDHIGKMGMDLLRLLDGHSAKYSKDTNNSRATPSAEQQELIDRIAPLILDLLNQAQQMEVEKLFSVNFLEQIPAAQIKNVLIATQKKYGDCNRYELTQYNGPGQFQLKLFCEKGVLDARLVVQPNSPHLIEGFLIQPSSK